MKKTMDLRVADGMYKGKKVPVWTDFIDDSYNAEAKKNNSVLNNQKYAQRNFRLERSRRALKQSSKSIA